MKKAEMIKILSDAIKMGIYVNENNGHLVVEDKEVSYILDQLVSAGMRRPQTKATGDENGMTNEWDD